MSASQKPWLTPARKRHAPHVVAAAAAVVAAFHYMDDPSLIYLGALAAAVSGVVYGIVRGVEWTYETIQRHA